MTTPCQTRGYHGGTPSHLTPPTVRGSRALAPAPALDPYVAALVAYAQMQPVPLALALGVFGQHAFLAIAVSGYGLDVAFALGRAAGRIEAVAAAPYRQTPEQASAVRRSAYATGVIKPRPRATAADRLRAEINRWGLA
jgi:hypothetical protein